MTTVVTLEVTYPTPLDAAKIDDELQFGVVAIDRDGKIKGSTRHAYRFTGSPRGAAEVTYAINDTLELPAQAMTLRVGASSQALGRAGTVHLPVEVINPSRADLQISSVVLGFTGPPREAAVPAGALKDLLPFQPTTTRAFRQADTLRVFAPIFWGSPGASAEVTISVRGDGTPAGLGDTRCGIAGRTPARSQARHDSPAASALAWPLCARAHGSAAERTDRTPGNRLRDQMIRDLRHALRTLASTPGVTAAAVLSLAIGIGANTALFSVANALLFRPLPYADADRLVILWNRSPGLNIAEDWFSTAQYFDIKTGHRGFEDLAIAIGANYNLTGGGDPERVGVIRVSSNLLPMLGARAAYGRLFTADDDSGQPATAVLSYGTWTRRYAAIRPSSAGRSRSTGRAIKSSACCLSRSRCRAKCCPRSASPRTARSFSRCRSPRTPRRSARARTTTSSASSRAA